MSDNTGAGYYRRRAQDYDSSAARTMALRLRVISRLALQPGDVVLDAGCGTGLSFEALSAAVGVQGRVIGIEASPSMMALARQRVLQMRLANVTLIEAPLETARWPPMADALLFNYVHDIVRSPSALEAAMRQARAGARVAAAGIKHPPRWLDPLRLYRRWKSRECYTSYEGLDKPWDLLDRYMAGLQVESTLWGTGYIAWGERAGE